MGLGLVNNDLNWCGLPSFDVYSSSENEAESQESYELNSKEFLSSVRNNNPNYKPFGERIAGEASGLSFPGSYLNHIFKVISTNKLSKGGEGQLKQAMIKHQDSRQCHHCF